MSRKFVVVYNGSGLFCEGIFDDYRTALGHAMAQIYELKESYKDPGDKFSFSDPYELEGEAGYGITITFKASCWKKSEKHYYWILFYGEPKTNEEE